MPAPRITMRKLKDILRLKHQSGLSHARIAAALGLSKGVVGKYVSLANAKGVAWPLPQGMDEAALERRLFPPPAQVGRFADPDFLEIHQELKRKGVTLQLLWGEYVAMHGQRALRYSQFCTRYRDWRAAQRRSMRQHHRGGEKLFIDYCGASVPIIDSATGELCKAQVFVAVWGASNYTYAEATRSQSTWDWIASHQRALRFFGGCPSLLVPDNLKSAVTRASRYEPELNATYADMARHYGLAVLPARPYKPKDKAKVEVGVQVVERWILARLRHHTFHSLAALNTAIRELLVELNERRLQRLPYSRRALFERLDRPAMQALPAQPYEYAEWKYVKPGIDYHVEIARRFYSVPHALVGRRLQARITATTVEAAADVLALAQAVGSEAAAQLERIAVERPEKIVVALGAATSNGPCLASLTLQAPRVPDRSCRRSPDPLTAGFRPGRVPQRVLTKRYFGGAPVLRSSVDRVDPAWIHGRGEDRRVAALAAATVAVLGCGSVGGPVALALAESGVGRIVLIDPDKLKWANIGRHPLGAESVRLNKAQALARLLQTRFPHIRVEAHPRRWEDVACAEPELLPGCDLIVSAMGDWATEGALNEWHLSADRPMPIVYGWTEPHACAGHAVAIARRGGCLQCGITYAGQPHLRLTEWPDGSVLRQEPACGAVYQPYGPVELAHVVALLAELALDSLLGTGTTSIHRIWAGRRRLLEVAGGKWTAAWIEVARDRLDGGFVHERPWPAFAACGECRRAEAA